MLSPTSNVVLIGMLVVFKLVSCGRAFVQQNNLLCETQEDQS